MKNRLKTATICVTNDLVSDQRIARHAAALTDDGWQVFFVGRKYARSASVPDFRLPHRYLSMWFSRGPAFYAEFNIRLFFFLLRKPGDLILANDLDTLPAAFLASTIRKRKLVYDSHEFFTGVPELTHNAFARNVWKFLERMLLPRVRWALTVNDSIARLYHEAYGVRMHVVRNIPPANHTSVFKTREELGLPADRKIIILQGAWINVDRGAEEALEAMKFLDHAVLLIAGSGDVVDALKRRAQDPLLKDKVFFRDKMPYDALAHYTANADLGLSLDKDSNINYRYSLPNKLFDYIRARIPVLVSPLAEVRKIVEEYDVGLVAESHDPRYLADTMRVMLDDEVNRKKWKANLDKAAAGLTWENERERFLSVIRSAC